MIVITTKKLDQRETVRAALRTDDGAGERRDGRRLSRLA